MKGCRVNGNDIGDGTSQGTCNVDHLCQSSGFCKHKKIVVTASCEGTYDTLQKLIWSPNYPSDYGINRKCNWKIIAPPGRQLHLEFNSFLTESYFDNLTLYDGATENSAKLNVFHGADLPPDIFSTSNALTLEFISDGKNNRRGFELEYSLKTNNDFRMIRNKRCQGSFKVLSALDVAMSKCSSIDCAIVDEGCDDFGKYKLYSRCDEEMEENANDGSCIYRHQLRDHLSNGNVQKLVVHLGWTFYKAKVNGKMLNENVNATCQQYGLVAPCYHFGKNGCYHNHPQCPIIKTVNSCKTILPELA